VSSFVLEKKFKRVFFSIKLFLQLAQSISSCVVIYCLNFVCFWVLGFAGAGCDYTHRCACRILWCKSDWFMEVSINLEECSWIECSFLPCRKLLLLYVSRISVQEALYCSLIVPCFFWGRGGNFDSLPCPWYKPLPLSLALSPRIYKEVADFRPDIIHASSPGLMVMPFLKVQHPLHIFLIFSSTYSVGPSHYWR
jgi:hypothetical protein